MVNEKGYYSLIQFCPNTSRLETINLGIILFCPTSKFLQVITNKNLRRAEKLTGRKRLDKKALRNAITAIEQRLQIDQHNFRTIEDLQQFTTTRANSIQLTAPRQIKISSPNDQLKQLFDELVDDII